MNLQAGFTMIDYEKLIINLIQVKLYFQIITKRSGNTFGNKKMRRLNYEASAGDLCCFSVSW